MSLERVVRPFETGDVFTARRIVPNINSNQVSSDTAVATWTGANSGKYLTAPDPWIQGFTVEYNEDKTQREVVSVRIENPDDKEQFVMVDRLKTAVFSNSRTGENYNLKFADWDKDRK